MGDIMSTADGPGILNLVSVGPGMADFILPRAVQALRASEVIVGYELYLQWIRPWIEGKEIHSPPLTRERERARLAIEAARLGRRVALVSSGDIGIYAMASLAFEEMREDDTFEVAVIPGVTAANACASLLGAPLSHDFAALSLSDLMCPWEWIEQRARHIGAADLACVLYNVQSQARADGVYRVLAILQEHKSPDTLCGVVRNAYRPGGSASVHRLAELPALTFDMLTTIVIGNRFTRRRRRWIYTPRGYHDWSEAPALASPALPARAVWVFAGTRDGNELARRLAAEGHPVVVSTATGYGGEVARLSCQGVAVWAGRQGMEPRRQALERGAARLILDATHPHAAQISAQLIELARQLGIPYLRLERPSLLDARNAIVCDDAADAARRAIELGRRIFLATGSKDLATFVRAPGAERCEWFVRLTPDPERLSRAIALGIARERILAMQGPFSAEFNRALWRAQRIDCVVTKDSGDTGGYGEKQSAAGELGIALLVIRRPHVDYPRQVASVEEAVQAAADLLGARMPPAAGAMP